VIKKTINFIHEANPRISIMSSLDTGGVGEAKEERAATDHVAIEMDETGAASAAAPAKEDDNVVKLELAPDRTQNPARLSWSERIVNRAKSYLRL